MGEGQMGPSACWKLCQQANALMEVDRNSEAVPLLQQAIDADPHNLRPRCLLALALHRLGDHPRSLKAAEEAIRLHPEAEWPHRLRSIILAAIGKRRQALEAARESIRVAPELPEALHTLASAELGVGRLKAARQTAERLRQIAPDRSFAHDVLGLVALRERKWKEAEEHYRRALRLNPESWISMNNLGLALQRQGRRKEAIERFHDAARLNPDAKLTRKNLSQAVSSYAGASGLGIWLILRHMTTIGKGDGLLLVPVLAVVTIGYGWWRRRRLRELHPTVVQFYMDESQRERRRMLRNIPAAAGLGTGTILSLFWTGCWLNYGAAEAGLQSWGVVTYVLLLGASAAGWAFVWRNAKHKKSKRL